MAEIIELDRFRRPDYDPGPALALEPDTIDTSRIAATPSEVQVPVDRDELASWLQGFKTQFERELAGADLLYFCLNRSLTETALNGVDAMSQVLPQCGRLAVVTDAMARARGDVRDIPMRDLVAEILNSNRVLWIEDPDRYGGLSFEFRRRIDIYNSFVEQIT